MFVFGQYDSSFCYTETHVDIFIMLMTGHARVLNRVSKPVCLFLLSERVIVLFIYFRPRWPLFVCK